MEADRAAAVQARLIRVPGNRAVTFRSVDAAGPLIVPKITGGRCLFFDEADSRLCAIQRDAGPELMPSACDNFPRVTLRDGRGIFITLSHFCPTAARMLLTDDEIAIVDAPPSLSLDGHVEGLDATAVLPPLLRAGMLMDLEGYAAWERAGVAVLNERTLSPRAAVATIRAATEDVCRWRPGRETLASAVAGAFARARMRPAPVDRQQDDFDRARSVFVAAHLFGSWAAYQQGGLIHIVDALDRALAAVDSPARDDEAFIAAVRDADLRSRHIGDHAGPGSISSLRPH
jgi:hypothetical protein